MACCDEFQKDENKVIKNGDLKGTTVQGTGALSGSGVVNATSSGTISIEHKTKFSGTGQTSPNTSQSPSFGGTFNVPVVKYDEYGHITGSTTATVSLPTPESQKRTELYVGSTDTTGNTASTNGNTKIKLGYSGGSIWDSKVIKGAGATSVSSDLNGNITIESPQLVDPSVSGWTEEIITYLKKEGNCCKADANRDIFVVGTDTLQMAPFQVYNYFAGDYDDGIRIHCPIFKNRDEMSGKSEFEQALYDLHGKAKESGGICGKVFVPKFMETGIVLCGYDNPCATGGSPKTWTIYNNGGHFSIARCWNHGTGSDADYIKCEAWPNEGSGNTECNTGRWWDPTGDTQNYEKRGMGLGTPQRDIREALRNKQGPGSGYFTDKPFYDTNNSREWQINKAWVVRSDRRLKENIESIPDDEVEKIWDKCKEDGFIKKFNLKSDNKTRKKYGVIAQEVKEIIPTTVVGFESENSYLHVDYDSVYGALIGTLIEKVKELEKKVEELEKKN